MKRVYEQPQKGIVLSGKYHIQLYGEHGELKKEQVSENVVCTNGKEFLASFLYSAAAAASTFTCKYIAIGTDATAANAANTALGTELARQTSTVSYVSNQIYQLTCTFATGTGTGAIVEYGLFSSSSAGTMLSRDVDSVINKGASDSLKITYQFTIS